MRVFEKWLSMSNGRVSALVTLLVTLILSVFPIRIIAQAGSREGTPKEREVFKAVLMYVAKQSRGGTANDVLYFVSVNDGDPSDSFLDELKKSGLNARKESDLKIEDALDKKLARREHAHARHFPVCRESAMAQRG